MKPTFACVYKRGPEYSREDVIRLMLNVERRTTIDFKFICLTDDPVLLPSDSSGVAEYPEHWAKPLKNNWPGWWSVPELYRLPGPIVVTGLDTVFVGSVDPFFELAMSLTEEEFYMIRAFKKGERWASGFMLWNGEGWRWLYNDFKYESDSKRYKWEQRYTKHSLLNRGVDIKATQDKIDGIYSYKHHCRREGHPPKDARAILFHGRPRPSQVGDSWVRKERRL